MADINRLSTLDIIASGDNLPIWDTSNGDTRKVSISALATYVLNQQAAATGVQEFITQYAAPSATSFNVNITDGSGNYWLVLTPTAGFAAGTITLPAIANVVNKQEVLVNCTQIVTTLTIDGNGAVGVTGAPTTLGANDFFRLKYDETLGTWYRVG